MNPMITETHLSKLSELVYDMFSGTPKEIDALFAAAEPTEPEQQQMRLCVEQILTPGEFMVYDFGSLVEEIRTRIRKEASDTRARLGQQDRTIVGSKVRNPTEMMYELMASTGSVDVFRHMDGWVWGPSGAPFKDTSYGNEHIYQHHARHHNADLDFVISKVERDGNEHSNRFYDRLYYRTNEAFSLIEAAVASHEKHHETLTHSDDLHAVAATGWAACLADRKAAEHNLRLALQAAPAAAWIACDSWEQTGWANISATARLEVLKTRWMSYPSDGDTAKFVWWWHNLNGGIVGWWNAVRLASGIEAGRVIAGEEYGVEQILGRDTRLTGG